MSKFDRLDALVDNKAECLKVSGAVKAGVSRPYISKYIKSRGLERVANGLYQSENAWPDGMYVIQVRYPQVNLSHETALYLLGLQIALQ